MKFDEPPIMTNHSLFPRVNLKNSNKHSRGQLQTYPSDAFFRPYMHYISNPGPRTAEMLKTTDYDSWEGRFIYLGRHLNKMGRNISLTARSCNCMDLYLFSHHPTNHAWSIQSVCQDL